MQVVPIRSKAAVLAGKRAQLKAQNRQVILEAARRVFAEAGYGATRIRDIVRATPLAAGTFYNYFRTKEDVLQALCEEAAQAVGPAMREARLKAKSAEAFFFATFSIFFGFIAERRRLAPVMHQESAALVSSGLKDDIHEAMARGVLPPVNPDLLSGAVCGIASSLVEALDIFGSAEAAARSATAFMITGFHAFISQNQQVAVNY